MDNRHYDFIEPTDTRLNTISREVELDELSSEQIGTIVHEMARIAMGERDAEHPDRPSMVGLSAPQIGIFKRIILYDANATGLKSNFNTDLVFLINPEITSVSRDEELGREGCYSTGDIGGAVFRHKEIGISGYALDGTRVEKTMSGFLARILQHEIDHLNGIRFPDRIRRPEHLHRLDFQSDEFQLYRENWRTWKKILPIEDWLKVKGGGDE